MMKILLLLAIAGSLAKAVDPSDDKSNEVEPKPPANLDPTLRKALLKAITDLENDSTTQDPITALAEGTTEVNEILETGDEEKKNDVDVDKSVANYHSFIVNEPNIEEDDSDVVPSSVNQNIDDDKLEGRSEDIETKETSNAAQSRNSQKEIFAEEDKSVTKKPIVNIQKSVSQQQNQVLPTAESIPRPSHNEDGENIEQLEDVQVFQAPLVAAFTVHQDINGLPKKVVPIYKQALRAPIVALPLSFRGNQNEQIQNVNNQQAVISQDQKQAEIIPDRLSLQQQLEQKQRLLEQQLREIQQQQKQHEELLRQQQLLQQQNQLAFEEQQRIKQQQFSQQSQIQQQNLIRAQEPIRQQLSTTSVTFEPSISLTPGQPQALPNTAELQPPQKEPSDFLNSFRSQPSAQFSNNALPVAPSPHQQPPFERNQASNFNNFNQQSALINQQLPVEKSFANRFNPAQGFGFQQQLPSDKPFLSFNTIPLQGPSSTRVFRHDSSSGNFGFNPNNLFNPVFLQQPQFRQQQSRFRIDDHLKNLLIQSGLTAKSQEDLSIVSKVLSLNHGVAPGGKTFSDNLQFFFGNGKRNEVPVRPRIN